MLKLSDNDRSSVKTTTVPYVPGGDVPHLTAAAVILQSLAQAPGTWRNKNMHVAQFEAFCESFNIPS